MTGSAIEAWTVALLRFKIGEVQEGGSRAASDDFTFFLIFICVLQCFVHRRPPKKRQKTRQLQRSENDPKMVPTWTQDGALL